jgi:hypothetical protein
LKSNWHEAGSKESCACLACSSTMKVGAVHSFEMSVNYTSVTSQRTVLFIDSSVRTRNPIHWWTFEDLHESVE